MYNGLLHLHNLLRWVILLLAVIAILRSFIGMTSNKIFSSTDRKIGFWLMTSSHIMLLIGLYQWFAGDLGLKLIRGSSLSAIMKTNDVARFWAIEHFLGMLIAIVLITIGRGVSKKNISDKAKHQRTFWYYFIALIIILVSIPWPFREGVARPWFPGMDITN